MDTWVPNGIIVPPNGVWGTKKGARIFVAPENLQTHRKIHRNSPPSAAWPRGRQQFHVPRDVYWPPLPAGKTTGPAWQILATKKNCTLRIQVCPKKGINPTILLWGCDRDHQTYSREGYGSFGLEHGWKTIL